jgi:hypothetical protein
MDRDAPPPAPASPAEAVPPFEWSAVRGVATAGLGMLAVAAALGGVATAAEVPWPVHTARLFLVLFGAITTGAAVSMRPDLWPAWAVGAVGAALAVPGTPAHWDSFRLLFVVLGAVAVGWTAVLAAPARYRAPVVAALVLFHFAGIFFATTTPPATPWVTEQAFVRIYNPYLQFLYLRNAYHFYSPQPGPASLLAFLVKTETADPATGEKKYTTKWVVMPRRPADVKDPLGLTYYRRLSLTEQLARGTPGLRANSYEGAEIRQRRLQMPIPMHPGDEQEIQYQLPNAEVVRYIIPSYASHVILEHTPDAKTAARTTVRVYRIQHNTMPVEEFVNARKRPGMITDPYHPTWYRPYFLGEFNAVGTLLNPQEPMLYWLVPILPRPGGVPPGSTTKREFLDYLSFHALGPDLLGPDTTVDDLSEPRFKDRVFDWGQLR